MTEEYKINLINYVTGNIQEGTPTTDEIIKEINNIPRSEWKDFLPPTWTRLHIEGIIKPNEDTSNLGILYGGYEEVDTGNIIGLVILTNINFQPIKLITEFENGTPLRYIQCMIQGDDNLFYAIDDENYAYYNTHIEDSQKRFLLLNNFTFKTDEDYKIILRKSYVLSGNNYQNFFCNQIFKEPNSSHFVFFGGYSPQSGQLPVRTKTIEFKINVGESNVWNYWNITENYHRTSAFVNFDSNSNFKIVFCAIRRIGYDVLLFTKDYNSNTFTSSTIHTFDFYLDLDIEYKNQNLFLDENNVYFVIDTQSLAASVPLERYLGLYHYQINTNTFETIKEFYYGSTQPTVVNAKIQIDKNDGKLYIAFYDNIDNTNKTADYYIQRYEGEWNPILIEENKPIYYQTREMYVKSNFNLLQINLFNGEMATSSGGKPIWNFINLKEIYNSTQYNGEPYESKDSLCPLYVNLYSTGSLVFSRNLYNISKQNNMSMSSVEIPNSYLNDATITQNDLVSETNVELVNDPTQWTKNIYEVVDLNFLNTIRVIDEDTNTEYLESAIKVNNATTDGGDTNYQNTPCNKYRINYSDGTTSIGALVWNSINNYNKKTQITFYVDKEINSIDLISNDETTIYLTIPVEATIGNYYTINQKVRTGNKPTPVQLQYNNEDINYQNQPVMVYVEE